MREKDPTTWVGLWDALPEPVRAALMSTLMSIVLSFFRVMYDDKEPRWMRRAFEVALCGSLGFAVSYAVTELGLSRGWSAAAASIIGLYGVEQVREWGRALAQRRIDRGAP